MQEGDRRPEEHPRGGPGNDPRLALGVVAAFLPLALIGVLHHEMWRDEMEIWLVARESASLGHLVANLRTEGHPALWYVLTWLVTRTTANPLGMQVAHVLIGTGSVYLFARFAPLPRIPRMLFCFGYFAFYEYAIISRAYGLQLLLTFAFCSLQHRRDHHPIALGLLLVALANTTLYGAIVATALVLAMLWEDAARGSLRRATSITAALAAAGVFACLIQMVVETANLGEGHYLGAAATFSLESVTRTLGTVHAGYLPIPQLRDWMFWNSSLIGSIPGLLGQLLNGLLGTVLLAGSALLLLRRPSALLAFVVGSGLMLVITFSFWHGYIRHHGQLFLLWATCCWLLFEDPDPEAARGSGWIGRLDGSLAQLGARVPAIAPGMLTVVLGVQVAVAAYAHTIDFRHPFSAGQQTAAYLRTHEAYPDALIVGTVDYAAQTVAGFIDKPIFYPESGRFGTFVDWGHDRQTVTLRRAFRDAVRLQRTEGRPIFLVASFMPVPNAVGDRIWLREDVPATIVASFQGAIVDDENFWVLLLEAPEPQR